MGIIYNATKEEQTIRALGNWFTFKPKQMKVLADNLSSWISVQKKEHGLIELSSAFEDPEYKNSEAGKAALAAAEAEGVESYLKHHRMIIANNQISLRRDLDQANIKADPAAFASDGEIESMKIVAKYASREEDIAQKRAEEVQRLMKAIKE
jgi:hypothetical protein